MSAIVPAASDAVSSFFTSIYDALKFMFTDAEAEQEEIDGAKQRLTLLSVESQMVTAMPAQYELELDRSKNNQQLWGIVRADVWNATAGDVDIVFHSSTALKCLVHRNIFTAARIRAHRSAYLDARGNKLDGYSSLLVDPDFMLVGVLAADHATRLNERSLEGTAKLSPPLNKTRDLFCATKLTYDPVQLCISMERGKIHYQYMHNAKQLNKHTLLTAFLDK